MINNTRPVRHLSDETHHSEKLSIESIKNHLSSTQPLNKALLQAYRSLPDSRNVPLFLCRYEYGADVTGLKEKGTYFSEFLPPCGNSRTCCRDCQELLKITEGHRPFVFVLTGAIEEYLEFQQVKKRGREPDITSERRAPVRITEPGECVGVYEALNAFYFDDYGKRGNKIFGAPARRLSAGAKSVFINAPLKELARSLRDTVGSNILRRHYGYGFNSFGFSELGTALDNDHSKLLKMLAEAAGTKWHCDLLVIPFKSLHQLIWDGTRARSSARDLLLEMHRIGWIQSRASRSERVRYAAAADVLARKGTNVYLEQSIEHLLSVARGNMPGFTPFRDQDQSGPFQEILEFINASKLADSFKCFPSIIHPAHLGNAKRERSVVYYSFAHPTLLTPLRKQHSGPDLMQELRIRMNSIKREGRGIAKDVGWHFYISSGLPKPERNFEIFEKSEDAAIDFYYQQKLALELDRLRDRPFFGPERDGFLSKFIRLHNQAP